mmetsp:Transcript_22083/g.52179  ORF Transcript_22083/g.52179 Transcript_22083/m.52179 type:complete len:554 (+) Transcript_22083:247-1908(+)
MKNDKQDGGIIRRNESVSASVQSSKSATSGNHRSVLTSQSSSSRERQGSGSSSRSGGRARSRSRHRSDERDARSKSRARSKSARRRPSDAGSTHRKHEGGSGTNRQSKKSSSNRARILKEHNTPFDSKGRCHAHSNVQLARRKLTGGWKVLFENCPKCLEEESDNDAKSVKSSRSSKSRSASRSKSSRKGLKLPSMNNHSQVDSAARLECPFDSHGYCHLHSHVRLAKRKLTGGWKILLPHCPECRVDKRGDDDNKSVCSRNSRRSIKSTRSMRSISSRKSGRGSSRRLIDETSSSDVSLHENRGKKSHREVKKMAYTDDEGHEGVYSGTVNPQRKPHGRGKIIYHDGSKYSGTWSEGTKVHGKTTKKTKSSSSSSSKATDKSGKLDKGHPATSGREGGGSGEKKAKKSSFISTSDSSAPPSLSTRDNRRKVAKVATTVQPSNQPSFTGVPVRPSRQSPASPGSSTAKQTALASYKELFNKQSTVVKNMIFVDFYGDRGRYTGEVNENKMPHGVGEITYDHGLVQEGKWTNGILEEESMNSSGLINPEREMYQ